MIFRLSIISWFFLLSMADQSNCPPTISAICNCDQTTANGISINCDNKNFDTVTTAIRNLTDVKIDRLSIRGSNINKISNTNFASVSIRDLDLSNNRINTIDGQAFQNQIASLRSLNLSNNQLSTMPKAIDILSNLEILDVSKNNLVTISDQSLQTSKKLRQISLAENKICDLPENSLSGVKDQLQLLNLSRNCFTNVWSSLKSFSNLEQVDLSSNQIQKLTSNAFNGMTHLKNLNLDNNRIDTVDASAFTNTVNVQAISLRNNVITNLAPGTFANLGNLQNLSLRHNQLSNLNTPSVFDASLIQLTNLNLAENQLTSISSDQFQKLNKLSRLDLSGNKLTGLITDTFTKKIDTVLLQGNPLVCDQSIDWLVNYLKKNNVVTSVANQPDVTCAAPPEKRGKPLKELPSVNVNAAGVNVNVPGSSTNASDKAANPIGDDFVKNLISSLVPGASAFIPGGGQAATTGAVGAGANAMGPLGLMPMLSKLTEPLSHMIASNGHPSPDDTNQLLKAIPDMTTLFGLSSLLGGGAGGLGGLLSGVGKSSSISGNGTTTMVNFTSWTKQQIDDLVNGVGPLPPLDTLPPDYIPLVLSGGAVPGLTVDQTQAIKQRYMKQIASGGGLGGSGGSAPLIGNVYANITNTNNFQLPESSLISDTTLDELKNLDLSSLPSDVLQSFLAGKTPDLNKIPQEFLQSLINKSPQLFSNIVSQELRKKFTNESISKDGSTTNSRANSKKTVTYDVNSLDRKADISMYRQDGDDHNANLWTAIVLGIIGLATIILIVILCWRRHRNQKLREANTRRDDRMANIEGMLAPASINIHPKSAIHTSTINETVDGSREIRENRLNAEISRNQQIRGATSDQRGGADERKEKSAYTERWVFSSNRNHNDSAGTQM